MYGKMEWLKDARVPLGMLVVQMIYAGMQLLSRVTLGQGTFVFALITYRNLVAAICIAPFALYWERYALRKIDFAIFLFLFILALIGITITLGLFYYGLRDTTTTYAMNLFTLVPTTITFLLSTILRIETLGMRSRAGKKKIIGTTLCLVGTLTIVLYKGKSFHFGHHANHGVKIVVKTTQNMTRGTLLVIASCFSFGVWLILQVKLFKVFPYKYCATMLTCVMASVQAMVIGMCIDKKPKAWNLGWDLQLVTIIYTGLLGTATSFSLILWSISKRGPMYPAMFNPLSLIIITIVEALLFGEVVHVGSLIGMTLIIVGLYSFLWGKNDEIRKRVALPERQENDEGGGKASTELTVVQSSATTMRDVSKISEIKD